MELKRLTALFLKAVLYGFISLNLSVGLLLLLPTLAYLLPFIAVCALSAYYFGRLLREAKINIIARQDAGETAYGFAGYDLRVFRDKAGQVWVRARDVRNLLGCERDDNRMSQLYPEGYRRANPKVTAWYIRTDTIQRHWQGSTKGEVNRFLHWMARELIPLQTRREEQARQLADQALPPPERQPSLPFLPVKAAHAAIRYGVSHWRGEHGLLQAVFGGGGITLLLGIALSRIKLPEDFVEHYQLYSLIALLMIVGYIPLLVWWNVGVWRSTQRWFSAERSLIIGILAAAIAMTTILYTLGNLGDRDQHFTALSYATFAVDLDPKPTLVISADGRRLRLSGEIGIGTTLKVRSFLNRNVSIVGIELSSPGGRVVEGFALARLIEQRSLDTYVGQSCASACVLVFAGGHQRLVAPSASFGLHRSGVSWRHEDRGLTTEDIRMRDYFLARGVESDFVRRGLVPPMHEIWVPSFNEVIASNLATGVWETH